MAMTQFKGVYPIAGEDLSALPVREIGPAVDFHRLVLRFTIVAGCDLSDARESPGLRLLADALRAGVVGARGL